MSPEEFAAKSYDYIIVGGGTAGLAIASRLSEDENITVGVLEAGASHLDDPLVTIPGLGVRTLSNPAHDWCLRTVPQKHANGREICWARGKGLGGSSQINFMMFAHPSRQDLERWKELGNPDWDWDNLAPYFKKFESYHPLDDSERQGYGDRYLNPDLRGTDGPIQVSLPAKARSWIHQIWSETFQNLGYPQPHDPRSGSVQGAFTQLTTIDPETATRSYSANAYYAPCKDRPNLIVLTESLVSRIEFDRRGESSDDVTAIGVKFLAGGNVYTARTRKEIIVTAGTVHTPQILELSGIGSPEILRKHDIEVVVENPGVGENLQDHLLVPLIWEVVDGVPTAETLRNPEVLTQAQSLYTTNKAGPLAGATTTVAYASLKTVAESSVSGDWNAYLESLDATDGKAMHSPDRAAESLLTQLKNAKQAAIQISASPRGADLSLTGTSIAASLFHQHPGAYCTLQSCTTHCFSRGSIHIQSSSAAEPPDIDPAYLSHPLDVEITARATLHLAQVARTEPFASKLKDDGKGGKLAQPGPAIPKTMEEAKVYVREVLVSNAHPVGTCPMLPKKHGGVVGPDLKIYGTKNVRVCDASIFPTIVQGNIVSVVYAIAEKAADMIKNGK